MIMAGILGRWVCFRIRRDASIPSMPGIFQSITTRSNGCSAGAASSSASPSFPDAASVTLKEKDSKISCRISRDVALSSTTSTFILRSSGVGENRFAAVPLPILKEAVKEKVVPCPGSLSTRISPPIISTRRLLMDSPRPVPPYFRVVEVSAWEKA